MAAHKAWRLFVGTNQNGADQVQVTELAMVTTGGSTVDLSLETYYASSAPFAGFEASVAFDGSTTGLSWASLTGSNEFVGVVSSVAFDVEAYRITAKTSISTTVNPKDFKLQYSDDTTTNQTEFDNATWTTVDERTGETGWSFGETRSYSITVATPVIQTAFINQQYAVDSFVSQESFLNQQYEVDSFVSQEAYLNQQYAVDAFVSVPTFHTQKYELNAFVTLETYLDQQYIVPAESLIEILSEGLTLSDLISFMGGLIMQETVAGSSTLTSQWVMSPQVLADVLALDDNQKIALSALLSEATTLDDAPTAAQVFLSTLVDTLQVDDTINSTLAAVQNLVDQFALIDVITSGFLGTLAEGVSLEDAVAQNAARAAKLVEDITIHLNSTDTVLVLAPVLKEVVSVDNVILSQQTIKEVLKEEVVFMALDNILGEGYQGWVMNPENFAVWNYENYNFNSLTFWKQQGLMANREGLYKSSGYKDMDSWITSKIKTAALDFGTSNLKRVDELYLGLDFKGNLSLIVVTEERVEARYKLTLPSTHTSTQHVDMPRGLISGAFQFELIHDGGEKFDLNEIELFPVLFGRKRR